MGAAIPVIMLAGAALQAQGAISQANAQKAASQYTARLNEQNALVAHEQASLDAIRVRKQGQQALGAAAAGYGAAGVQMDGSPLDVLAMSASESKLDEETVKYKGTLKALGYRSNAALDRMAGDNAMRQGGHQAASALLTGVGRAGAQGVAGGRQIPTRGADSGIYYED